jgi:hypothetical protein
VTVPFQKSSGTMPPRHSKMSDNAISFVELPQTVMPFLRYDEAIAEYVRPCPRGHGWYQSDDLTIHRGY